jgi:hypothetical protein
LALDIEVWRFSGVWILALGASQHQPESFRANPNQTEPEFFPSFHWPVKASQGQSRLVKASPGKSNQKVSVSSTGPVIAFFTTIPVTIGHPTVTIGHHR